LRPLEVRRRGAHFQTTTVLTELFWNDHPIEEMTVIAHGVRLIPSVPARVRTTSLDITGTVTTAVLVEWLNTWQLDWKLDADASGLIIAKHRRWQVRAVVEAAVVDNVLGIAVHRADWLGIRIPRWLITVHPIALTGLPKAIRIMRAEHDGVQVRFRIDLPEVTGSFDLAQIRSAIVAGTTLIVF
jgi:hypothetical protein